ncbi:serine protease [Pseudoalteromonas luteoviolacea]|uniref:serine protease n=1 Tax=Pseudoalteromonas luteoviolacea TaxID=43657 RepID=UPI00115327B4|nr:serine protease [Pseudoalteromonas luteoviolacea]TQF71350.1 trypsin-like serine protease [Pseudoalteromonas luteoviolacea]
MYNKLQGLLFLATIATPLISQANSKTVALLNDAADSRIIEPRIVGGQETTPFAYPFMGSLQLNGNHFCGLSFIGDNKVLTASHCIEGIPASSFTVKFEGHDLTVESQWQTYNVVAMSMHDQYNVELQYNNDIAVLELDRPVQNITPIKLADQDIRNGLVAGDSLKVMGWGRLSSGGEAPTKLQEVDVPYVTNEVCNDATHYNGQISDTMICAGLEEGGRDSCQGDSGGPLIVQRNNEWFQVGVVSWGDGCALPNKPGVYADVESLFYWVQSKASGFGFGQTETHIYSQDQASMSIQGTFKNTLDYPLAIADFGLSNHAEGLQFAEQNCANSVLEPGSQCQFEVMTPDNSKHGKYTVDANITSPSASVYSAVFGYTKLADFEQNVNELMSTPISIKWSTGGNENWFVDSNPEQQPLLVSGDISDRSENPEITQPYQTSTLMVEIDDTHIKAFGFDYLISSEGGYDFVKIFHNGEQVHLDSGNEGAYESFDLDLVSGLNLIRIEYSKDFTVTEGDDNVTLKNIRTTFANARPSIELVQTELNVRSEVEFTLDASATLDPDGDNITFAWIELSNPDTIISTQSSTVMIADKVNDDTTKIYQVTATDEYGATSSSLVKVNIAKNHAPQIALAKEVITVRSESEFILDASQTTDKENDAISYSWVKLAAEDQQVSAESTVKLKAEKAAQDLIVVYQLAATDQFGAASTTLVKVNVIKNNAPQFTLSSSSSSVHEGDALSINVVGAEDPDGDNITISWEQTSGPSVTLPDNNGQFSFTAPDVNETSTLVIKVTATDEFGMSHSETVSVEVKNKDSGGSLGIFSLLILTLLTSVRRVRK